MGVMGVGARGGGGGGGGGGGPAGGGGAFGSPPPPPGKTNCLYCRQANTVHFRTTLPYYC